MYNDFYQKLREICNIHRISLRFSDVLEETIAIKLAGMKSVPSRCQFFADKDEQFMFIGFDFDGQAMPLEDKDRLIQYFNTKLRETMLGGCQYVYNEKKRLHCFRLNCNDVMNYLLPDIERYLSEAAASHPEALAEYQQRSAHEFACHDFNKKVPAFLETYYIDFRAKAFEKSLLMMAGCTGQSKRFRIYPAEEIGKVIFSYDFGIHGMSEIDKNKLLSFFNMIGDETASYNYTEDGHCFCVRYEILAHVFDVFKEHIDYAAKIQSAFFKDFQRVSTLQAERMKRLCTDREISAICYELKEYFIFEYIPIQGLDDLHHAIGEAAEKLDDSVWSELQYEKIDSLGELIQNKFHDNSRRIAAMQSIDRLKAIVNKLYDELMPRGYMIFLPNPQYQLAQKMANSYAKLALSQFHAMVPNAQAPYKEKDNANYPYKIEAHIASYLADNNKYTCKFGVDGSLLYPSDIGKNDAEAREKFELDVYCAAKKIVESTNESKQGMSSNLWSFFVGSSKAPAKGVNKKKQFDEFLETQGVKKIGGEPTFKMR